MAGLSLFAVGQHDCKIATSLLNEIFQWRPERIHDVSCHVSVMDYFKTFCLGYWGHTMPWLLTSRAQRSYGYGPFIVQFELRERGHVGFVDFDFVEWNWSYENCLHLNWNLSPFAHLTRNPSPSTFFLSKTTNLSFFSAITVLRLPIARATQATTAPSLEKIVSHFPFLDVQ